MLYNMARKFGRRTKVDGIDFFTFPSAADINNASVDELRGCGLGYRTKAIKAAAEAIASGRLDFDFLKKASYHESKKELLQVYGIGNKIADCVLLFSLEAGFTKANSMIRLLPISMSSYQMAQESILASMQDMLSSIFTITQDRLQVKNGDK
jgi:N-glycosylase/DNA lyase